MPPVSTVQMNLAGQASFLARLQYLLMAQAAVVLAEALNTAHHAARLAYARSVILYPTETTSRASAFVVGGINVTSATTWEGSEAVTTVTDAALLSQIATFWNALSGAETGS